MLCSIKTALSCVGSVLKSPYRVITGLMVVNGLYFMPYLHYSRFVLSVLPVRLATCRLVVSYFFLVPVYSAMAKP